MPNPRFAALLVTMMLVAPSAQAQSEYEPVTIKGGQLQNLTELPQVVMFERKGERSSITLKPGASRSIGGGVVRIKRVIPAALGMEAPQKSRCAPLSLADRVQVYSPYKKSNQAIAGAVDEAAVLIDSSRSDMDEIAKQAYQLRESDPDLGAQLDSLDTEMSYVGDMRYAELMDHDGSASEYDRLRAEGDALAKKRRALVEDAQIRNTSQWLSDRASNSSEATEEKERLFARQANELAKRQRQYEQLLDSYVSELSAVDKQFVAERAFRKELSRTLADEDLFWSRPIAGISGRLACGDSPFADRLLVTLRDGDTIAPRYLRGTIAFDSRESLDLVLVPITEQTGSFASDFYWPAKAKKAVVSIGDATFPLSRKHAFTDVIDDVKSDLVAVKRAKQKARHNSDGGLSQDSGVFGF